MSLPKNKISQKYLFLISIIFIFTFCTNPTTNNNSHKKDKVKLDFATGFEVLKHNKFTEIVVNNPWQNAKDVHYTYLLAKNLDDIPKNIDGIRIKTPIKTVICLSTTHLAFIDLLNESNSIVGISGINNVYNPDLIKKIQAKEIKEVGYNENLNYETIVNLKPDIVFAYGVGAEISKLISKLEELNIKVVIIAEYLEGSILGKTEWIKFIAPFFNKEKIGSEKFNNIKNKYLSLKIVADTIKYKPKILLGLPWKGTWWLPGGKSNIAQLISDAGGDYLWKNNLSTQALPSSLEKVFLKSQNADIWINTGTLKSILDLPKIDERLGKLSIIEKGEIFNNNAKINKMGGNDYWESGVVNPHIILKDLISIFHPQIFPKYQTIYYKKLSK